MTSEIPCLSHPELLQPIAMQVSCASGSFGKGTLPVRLTQLAHNDVHASCTVQKGHMTNRLGVRLNDEHRRRLDALAQEEGVAISEVVRNMIDAAYEDMLRTRRQQAVERLIGLNLEDPPDPDTISRELEATHTPGGLC